MLLCVNGAAGNRKEMEQNVFDLSSANMHSTTIRSDRLYDVIKIMGVTSIA